MAPSEKSLKNLKHFKKGESGNPNGRPLGVISVVTRMREKFRDNPELLDDFLERYMKNPQNEKHITEMLDGKPFARGEMKLDLPTSLIEIIGGITNKEADSALPGEDTE